MNDNSIQQQHLLTAYTLELRSLLPSIKVCCSVFLVMILQILGFFIADSELLKALSMYTAIITVDIHILYVYLLLYF